MDHLAQIVRQRGERCGDVGRVGCQVAVGRIVRWRRLDVLVKRRVPPSLAFRSPAIRFMPRTNEDISHWILDAGECLLTPYHAGKRLLHDIRGVGRIAERRA